MSQTRSPAGALTAQHPLLLLRERVVERRAAERAGQRIRELDLPPRIDRSFLPERPDSDRQGARVQRRPPPRRARETWCMRARARRAAGPPGRARPARRAMRERARARATADGPRGRGHERRSRSQATLPRPRTTAAGKETCPRPHVSPTSPAAIPWSIAMPAYVLLRLQTAPTSPSPVPTPASTPANGPPTSPARITVGRFEAEDDARAEHHREEPVGRADRREDDEGPG